jgi:glycosyltransferase involved in cell wall biosynthesis
MPQKTILLATRALVPPWDEASKNFAYFLAKSITRYAVTVFTTPVALPDLPSTVTQDPCYTSPHLDFNQKLRLLNALRNHRDDFDITHYLFTPTRRNTSMIKFFSHPTRGKTIQTIATLREDLYKPSELRDLLFADHLVVYSDHSKARLEKLGFANVSRIYPGVDLDLYRPGEKDADTMKLFDLHASDFVVTYPGEYMRLGATDLLTDWLIGHYRNTPDSNMKFLFACRVKHDDDAMKKNEIKHRFERAGILDRIRFTDTYADMPKLYHLSDVVLFPVSDMRGKFDIPLVIIEAYACGKPVILSDLPIFGEFSGERFCATIPRGSRADLSEKLAYLKENKEARETMGRNARTFVEQNFDLKKTVAEYEQLYETL